MEPESHTFRDPGGGLIAGEIDGVRGEGPGGGKQSLVIVDALGALFVPGRRLGMSLPPPWVHKSCS